MYGNKDEVGFHYAVNYNWMLNKYIGTSVGAMIYHYKVDGIGWQASNQNIYYSLDDENYKHINITSSLFFLLPLSKTIGLYNHNSFFFEPVPLESVSLDKTTYGAEGEQTKTVSKLQYSRFSPGVFSEIGLYCNLNKKENRLKLFLGFGCGWYDVYSAFRHCTIDKQRLEEYVTRNKAYYRISLKLIDL
ncbi:hypothetical protein D0T50_04560 [Bacteroides sp. 214]|nr:hypothetical protein [Bacteroides sp. 214]